MRKHIVNTVRQLLSGSREKESADVMITLHLMISKIEQVCWVIMCQGRTADPFYRTS